MKKNYQKLVEIMGWEKFNGETDADVLAKEGVTPDLIPHKRIIEVVHATGLEGWAKNSNFTCLETLKSEIIKTFRIAINSRISENRRMKELFPAITNFAIYANTIDRRGKMENEADRIAESAWFGELARKRLEERTEKMFSKKPNKKLYDEAVNKIKEVYCFSDAVIDAFRFFVCQTRHKDHNPSMNKSLYIWGKPKQTGKTTLARALVSVLNGETSIRNAGNYESTLAKEMQYNAHDLPLAAQSNAVILDESMPKDSRKAYAQIKSMLTSNSCSYNQKWGKISHIETRRFYICTSNEDIEEFIQDATERRFISIKLDKVPKQLSFEAIYELWKKFAQNATPKTENWQEWYNSFEEVDGLQSRDKNHFKASILNYKNIVHVIHETGGYNLTASFFEKLFIVGKPTRDERKALNDALVELFGESKGYRWSAKNVRDTLTNLIDSQNAEDIEQGNLSEEDLEAVRDLPF